MKVSHRTAVYIDVSESSINAGRYAERVFRFLESINQDGDSPDGTIKCDVYYVSDKITDGDANDILRHRGSKGYDIGLAASHARAHGYDMMILVTPGSFSLPTNTILESTREDVSEPLPEEEGEQ